MGVLSVILLGCLALLSASSSGNEDAHYIRGQDNNGLVTMKGCEGHQRGDQWGSSYHHNCICKGPDRLCYPVNCLPGSEIVRDLNDLWNCEVVRSKREITESAKAVHSRGKRMTGLDAFGVFSGVVGTIGFILDRIEAAQTTAQLNEIQDQIQKLDTKMDVLTRSVSDLKLGQEYSQLVFLYGRDEQRLRNMIKTLANLQISSGKYILPGHRIQHWADMVLSYGSDGVHEVLEHLREMVFPSGIFAGKGLFEICHKRLITSYMSKYSEKMKQKVAQVYGLFGGGYAVWIAALRIKGITADISHIKEEGEGRLRDLESFLQKYTAWRVDHRCGKGFLAENGKPAQCNPDGWNPCCSGNQWCTNNNPCNCQGVCGLQEKG
ncbi:PREDICTED: uncharacterized protein LOC109488149 isoform X2 [Branchiostoma belcheri]|uniref:Uncharacterized protein LOC109488149 isoform X2 n=1 Tax=Branchiostoma belcheri TaxID=7741 RepID=A0A6P5AXX9_BRABE|nr:PREDICTED: uncharacterized protein LOC109488149 isoform X2 [Branchiostoma belcheri]